MVIFLTHCVYFVAIAEEESFSKAAKSLHVSQPSLSNAIMKLEKETELVLFERNTRGLHLTEAGELFYRRAVKLLQNFDHLKIKIYKLTSNVAVTPFFRIANFR